MTDYGHADRRRLIAGRAPDRAHALDARRAAAIAWMGPRWLLHPDNRVRRVPPPPVPPAGGPRECE